MSIATPTRSEPILNRLRLPLLIHQRNKYPMGIFIGVVAGLLYWGPNHIHLFPPQYLPFLALDYTVPFVPETIWIYISEYVFYVAIYVSCKNLMTVNKWVYSVLFLQIMSVVIFWVWPTTYPRDLFPLPVSLDSWSTVAFETLRALDSPANCCPSLHVSSVILSALILFESKSKKSLLFLAWATAIALSTLTTKQHYIVDVIAGVFMALATFWVFERFVRYGHSSSTH